MLRRFDRAKDHDTLDLWYTARGLPKVGHLPDVGLIEPEVAAGFLYRTDGEFALIDSYVTNPDASMRARAKALEAITVALLELAGILGYGRVTAVTRERSIRKMAERHGLKMVGACSMLAKELE